MKIFKLLILSAVMLSGMSFIDDMDEEETMYTMQSSELFGPIYEGSTSYNGSIYFTPTKAEHINIRCDIEIYMYDDGDEIYGHEIFYKRFTTQRGKNIVTYSLSFPGGFSSPKNFHFFIATNYGDYISEYHCKIHPCPIKYKITENNKNNVVFDKYTAKVGKNGNISETYDYSNVLPYFTNDRYYRLMVNSMMIKYTSSNKYSYGSAYLYFDDPDNIFPHLEENVNRKKHIELKCEMVGNYITFAYKNMMYVNPKNMQMSMTQKPGFLTCKYFYLPLGQEERFDGYIFTLTIHSSGVSKIELSYDIVFNTGYSLVGDCIDSDYCVVGGVRV